MTQTKWLTYHDVVVLNFIAIGGIAVGSVIVVAVLFVVVVIVVFCGVMRYSTRNKSKVKM